MHVTRFSQRTVATTLSTIALAAFAIMPAQATTGSGLPAECEAALRQAHEHITLTKDVIGFEGALLYLQATAGAPCGFDVTGTTSNTVDAEAFNRFIHELNDSSPDEPQSSPSLEDITDRLIGAAGTEPCVVGAGGKGVIRASVIGILVGEYLAIGKWQPAAENGQKDVMEVTGHAGLVGGTQIGLAGLIYVGPLSLPAVGSTSAWCVAIPTGVVMEETCVWFVIGYKCWQEGEVTFDYIACGSSAQQNVPGLDIAQLTHSYKTAAIECQPSSGDDQSAA